MNALQGLEGRLLDRLGQVEDRLRGEIHAGLEGLRREMLGHFDAIYQRFDRLETEYQMI